MVTTLAIVHRVRDFGSWKPIYDEHGTSRKEHGCTSETLFRGDDDPNNVTVVLEFPDRAAVDGFIEDPSLKEAMGHAGVEGRPTFCFSD